MEFIVVVFILISCAIFVFFFRYRSHCEKALLQKAIRAVSDGDVETLRSLSNRIEQRHGPRLLDEALLREKLNVVQFLVEEWKVPFLNSRTLFDAMYGDDRKTIRYFIQMGASLQVMAQDPKYLCLACYKNDMELCQWLIAHGADPNTPYSALCLGETPLEIAAEQGYADLFHFLLANGAELNLASHNEDGITIFHFAARGGNLELCRFLIDQGADIHIKTSGGALPIHYAAMATEPDVCRELIELGSDFELSACLHSRSTTPLTPIGCANSRTFRVLDEAGAKYDLHTTTRYWPETFLEMAALEGDLELCERFWKEGADLYAVQPFSKTNLLYTAVSGWVWQLINGEKRKEPNDFRALCVWLLEHGVTSEQENREDVLSYAARAGRVEIFRFLVESGVEYRPRSRSGRWIRHCAKGQAARGCPELLELLQEIANR